MAKWNVPSGYLTAKGTVLETYFGQYLGQWLADKGLLTTERCASGEGIFAYANGVQRTIATGKRLFLVHLRAVMFNCNITVKFGSEKDPIFYDKSPQPQVKL